MRLDPLLYIIGSALKETVPGPYIWIIWITNTLLSDISFKKVTTLAPNSYYQYCRSTMKAAS